MDDKGQRILQSVSAYGLHMSCLSLPVSKTRFLSLLAAFSSRLRGFAGWNIAKTPHKFGPEDDTCSMIESGAKPEGIALNFDCKI